MRGASPDFPCEACYKRGEDFVCVRTSPRYHSVMARRIREVQEAALQAPVLSVPRAARSSRARVNAVAGPSRLSPPRNLSRGASVSTLVPPVGGSRGPTRPDFRGTALLWRGELSRAEEAANAAIRHVNFVRARCLEAFGHWYAEEARGFALRSKGKGPSESAVEGDTRDKGKGRAEPMALDPDEGDTTDVDTTDSDEGEVWGRISDSAGPSPYV